MVGSFFFMGKFAPYASQSRDATQNSRHTLLIRATPLRIRAIRPAFARRHLEFAPYAPHSRDATWNSRHTLLIRATPFKNRATRLNLLSTRVNRDSIP